MFDRRRGKSIKSIFDQLKLDLSKLDANQLKLNLIWKSAYKPTLRLALVHGVNIMVYFCLFVYVIRLQGWRK